MKNELMAKSMHSAGISHIRHATQAALACPELLHTCKLRCNPLSKKLLYMVYDLMVIFIVIGISSVLVADLSVFFTFHICTRMSGDVLEQANTKMQPNIYYCR